jgi:hypothetical protein
VPMHDWTRVDSGVFHAFHTLWIAGIQRALVERLPGEYYCLPEQRAGAFIPDVLALSHGQAHRSSGSTGTTALLTPPRTSLFQESAKDPFLARQRRIVIRHSSGDRVVAVIEIVSPGNKDTSTRVRQFVQKTRDLLAECVHLLLVDPLPGGTAAPEGLHAEIFADSVDEPLRCTADRPLSLVSYECAERVRAWMERLAVGDALPDMPVFLEPGMHVPVPLESTYMEAWLGMPLRWRDVVATYG